LPTPNATWASISRRDRTSSFFGWPVGFLMPEPSSRASPSTVTSFLPMSSSTSARAEPATHVTSAAASAAREPDAMGYFSPVPAVTLKSIAGRFSSGVVRPPFSKPDASMRVALPSAAVNVWLARTVNVYLLRYLNTP
jgi:hypothetical protein